MFTALFLVLLTVTSCTEESVGDDEIATPLEPVYSSPSTVEGYLHPFQCEMWLEFEGQGRDRWACPGPEDLQVRIDMDAGTVFFRSPREIQLLQLWEDKGFCAVGYSSAFLSREYDFWVLSVDLASEFLACMQESPSGLYFRLALMS